MSNSENLYKWNEALYIKLTNSEKCTGCEPASPPMYKQYFDTDCPVITS